MLPPALVRALRTLSIVMMAVAAIFGIPIIIDPPPRDQSAEVREADGRGARPRRRRRRAS
jgi:hypothetical protein